MRYKSSRNDALNVSSAQAILQGLALDGGLFVPDGNLPKLNLKDLSGKKYTEVAFEVLRVLLPDFDEDFLRKEIEASYGESFNGKTGHIHELNSELFSLELWHGPTCAFKDYALQLMPRLFVQARKMMNVHDEALIFVATSGDTGKAALEGFKNLEGVKVAVFYPDNGTSEIQRLQMSTQDGNNVAVFAVEGNFDDAQRGVKAAFSSTELAEELKAKGRFLSSANSINWGRLVPQIVYYVTSYLTLVEQGKLTMGQALDFCVPTGNFGDILAGYYAKAMGVPVGKLVCAANQNNVLADFFSTGTFNPSRPLHLTSSPSMDVLVSSNLERLLCHESKSSETVNGWMQALREKGSFTVDEATMQSINASFGAGWASEEEVTQTINYLWEEYRYLADPHTAVAFCVAQKQEEKQNPMVVLSTASPYKFCGKVLSSLGQSVPENEFDAIRQLEKFSGLPAPKALTSLENKPERFSEIIKAPEILNIPLTI